MVSKIINLALRGFQFFCALVIMSLIGNMIAESIGGNHSVVNFDMFVAIFAMLSLFYLIFCAVKDAAIGHPIIPLVLDALNTLFFLCAAIATAAYLGVHSCNNDSYTRRNPITNGSLDREKRCREAQASTAFLWFGFLAFAASTAFSLMNSRGANMRGGSTRSGPTMSQV